MWLRRRSGRVLGFLWSLERRYKGYVHGLRGRHDYSSFLPPEGSTEMAGRLECRSFSL